MLINIESTVEEYFSNVFHGVCAVVGGKGPGLTDGGNVTHVSDRGGREGEDAGQVVFDFLVGWVGLGHGVVSVFVGVVGAAREVSRGYLK